MLADTCLYEHIFHVNKIRLYINLVENNHGVKHGNKKKKKLNTYRQMDKCINTNTSQKKKHDKCQSMPFLLSPRNCSLSFVFFYNKKCKLQCMV